MRRFVRDNGIALFFGVLLLGSLAGQAISGHAEYNNQQVAHGGAEVGLGHYLTSGSFATDVMENWQSEFLQFSLFIFATIWFVQRGSPESKEPGKGGRESEEEQRLGRWAGRGAPAPARRAGGLLRVLYENSLLLVMLQRRRFAGRAARHQSVGALADLPGDVLLKCGFVDSAVLERGNQCDERPLEHGILPASAAACCER